MTSVTIRTFPTPRLTNLFFSAATIDVGSSPVFDLVAYLISQLPLLGDRGLSGYTYMFQGFPNPVDGGATTVTGMIGTVALQDTQDSLDMLKLWTPLFAHINSTWTDVMISQDITTYSSFLAWYRDHYDMTTTGTNTYVGSRLLDAAAVTTNLTASAEAFKQFSSGGVATAYLVSGKGVHNTRPRGGSDAVLPAWRNAYIHAAVGTDFPPLNATAKAEAVTRISYYVSALRKLAPDSGAYMNEADPYEPDWQHQFWGENYERLLKIKRAVDPDDSLWCHPCVGNERWKEVGNQLCRV